MTTQDLKDLVMFCFKNLVRNNEFFLSEFLFENISIPMPIASDTMLSGYVVISIYNICMWQMILLVVNEDREKINSVEIKYIAARDRWSYHLRNHQIYNHKTDTEGFHFMPKPLKNSEFESRITYVSFSNWQWRREIAWAGFDDLSYLKLKYLLWGRKTSIIKSILGHNDFWKHPWYSLALIIEF